MEIPSDNTSDKCRKKKRSRPLSGGHGGVAGGATTGGGGSRGGPTREDGPALFQKVKWQKRLPQPDFLPQTGATILTPDAPALVLPHPRYGREQCDLLAYGRAGKGRRRHNATGNTDIHPRHVPKAKGEALQELAEEIIAVLQTRGIVSKEDIATVTGAPMSDINNILEVLLCTPLASTVFVAASSTLPKDDSSCSSSSSSSSSPNTSSLNTTRNSWKSNDTKSSSHPDNGGSSSRARIRSAGGPTSLPISRRSHARRNPGRAYYTWGDGNYRLPVPVALRSLRRKLGEAGDRLQPLVARVATLEAAVEEMEARSSGEVQEEEEEGRKDNKEGEGEGGWKLGDDGKRGNDGAAGSSRRCSKKKRRGEGIGKRCEVSEVRQVLRTCMEKGERNKTGEWTEEEERTWRFYKQALRVLERKTTAI